MKEVRISVIFDLVEGFERQTVKDEVWVTYETGATPVVLDADMYALRDHAFRKMDARLDALKAHVRAVAEASAHPNGGKKSNGTGKGKPSAGMLATIINAAAGRGRP